MSARTVLADALATAFPDWTIRRHPTAPDAITRNSIIIYGTTLEPAGLDPSKIVAELELYVVVPGDDSAAIEDALDAAVEIVANALDGMPAILWEKAERTTLGSIAAAWRFTLKAVYQKEST